MRCRIRFGTVVRLFFVQCCLFFAVTDAPAADPNPQNKIIVAGPPAGVSNALVHMANQSEQQSLPWTVEFKLWTTPDQLRAIALEGKVDFIALPTNVAANLYNRGSELQLLNVAQWGALWIVSRDATKENLIDFKNERIAVPFRADMPDIILRHLLEKQGLNIKTALDLHYTATPIEAMQLLITRRVNHALLAEPAVSMALLKTGSFPLSAISPELHRSIDLQKQWGETMNTQARIPQAGIAVLHPQRKDPALIEAFLDAYESANAWCYEHAQTCAKQVSDAIPMLDAEAVQASIEHQTPHYARIDTASAELQHFFQILYDSDPASIGNALPDEGFYHQRQSAP